MPIFLKVFVIFQNPFYFFTFCAILYSIKFPFKERNMDEKKIMRINELTAISRKRALTDAEQAERASLRREYIDAVKANLEAQLKNIEFVDKK